MPQRPWMHPDLIEWSIVGMNHYRVSGMRRLFVAMSLDGRLIKAEGLDTMELWEELRRQARRHDRGAPLSVKPPGPRPRPLQSAAAVEIAERGLARRRLTTIDRGE